MRSPKNAPNCHLSKRGYGTSPKAVEIAEPRKSVNLVIDGEYQTVNTEYMYEFERNKI